MNIMETQLQVELIAMIGWEGKILDDRMALEVSVIHVDKVEAVALTWVSMN